MYILLCLNTFLIQAEHIYGINFRAPFGYLDYDYFDSWGFNTQFQPSHWSLFKDTRSHIPIGYIFKDPHFLEDFLYVIFQAQAGDSRMGNLSSPGEERL